MSEPAPCHKNTLTPSTAASAHTRELAMPSTRGILLLLLLACVFWWVIFGLKWVNFWLGMAVAASTLAGVSAWRWGVDIKRAQINTRSALLGLVSALALYGLFWLGDTASNAVFAFAKPQVANIYTIRDAGTAWGIGLILLFITSPAEELFWRGTVQRFAMQRFGDTAGWLLAAAVYAGVHIASGNLMLTLAALVAGLFWGWLYTRTHNLTACIVSHALWTVSVFLLFPLQ